MISKPNLLILLALVYPYCRLTSAEEGLLDLSCIKSIDCNQYMNQIQNISAVCINHKCICTNDTTQQLACSVQTDLAVNNQIGGKCDCKIQNSYCSSNGFCLCAPEFIESTDKLRCLRKKVPLSDECENDSQCTRNSPFSKCDSNGKCQCLPSFAIYKKSCQSLMALDHTCANETSCLRLFNHTICVHNRCMCEDGYVAQSDNTACIPNLHFGDACSDSKQCTHNLRSGALCINGTCSCNVDYVPAKLQADNDTVYICENRKAIGDMCLENADCYQYHKDAESPAMECYLTECNCRAGYDHQDRYCVKRNGAIRAAEASLPLAVVVILYFLK